MQEVGSPEALAALANQADADDAARRDVDAHLLLPLQVARNAASKVRPGGTVLFMGGTGGRRTAAGLSFISALTAALSVSTVRLPTFSPVAISPASAQGVHETRDSSVDR